MQTLAEAAWEHWAEHAPRSWSCPLCDFNAYWMPAAVDFGVPASIARHAAERHPAYLPERPTIADMLDTIPTLVREAWLTVDAPNPDGARVGSRGASRDELVLSIINPEKDSPRWTRAPRRISLGRALRPGLGSSLFAPVLECSRLIWEALPDDERQAHPNYLGEPCWRDEIAWLKGVWPTAQAYLDPVDFAWIDSELRGVWASLAALAGVRPRPRNLCPDCRAPLHLGDDDWQVCDAGHQHPGPRRLEREWRRKAPMATKELCEKLRIGERTLLRYHADKRIKPTRSEGRKLFWLPWDVIRCRYPDIVAGIDERDDAA